MTSLLLTHWFPVLFHASSISEFGVASKNLQKRKEPVMCTRDVINAPADAHTIDDLCAIVWGLQTDMALHFWTRRDKIWKLKDKIHDGGMAIVNNLKRCEITILGALFEV